MSTSCYFIKKIVLVVGNSMHPCCFILGIFSTLLYLIRVLVSEEVTRYKHYETM